MIDRASLFFESVRDIVDRGVVFSARNGCVGDGADVRVQSRASCVCFSAVVADILADLREHVSQDGSDQAGDDCDRLEPLGEVGGAQAAARRAARR